MAVTYTGTLFEVTGVTNPLKTTLAGGFNIKAGATIVLYLTGKSADSNLLSVSKITDSKGNTYQVKQFSSSFRASAIAVARTEQMMLDTTDWIQVKWNRTPGAVWVSAHVFEGTDDVFLSSGSENGSSTIFDKTFDTPSGDWLLLQCLSIPYVALPTTTVIGSTVKRDQRSGPPSSEGYSLAGSGAGTATIGSTVASSATYSLVAVVLGGQAMPASASKIMGGFMGI